MKTKKWRFLTLLLVLVFGLGLTPFPSWAGESENLGPQADFNGDRYADLAIGVPNDSPDGIADAGGVNTVYGSASGLNPLGIQHWHQGQTGMEGSAELLDHFGDALAVGDFDGDGYYDLAVGVPYETVSGVGGAGAVQIIYGSGGGLSTTRNTILDQNGSNSPPETGDWFATTLAAGDFDGDGVDDLAIGVPYEDWDAQDDGIVHIIYGMSSLGLSDLHSIRETWRQGADGLPESGEIGDKFGKTLAVGDFNNDGRDDLAIGVESEDFDDPQRYATGVVHVLYGTDDGLSATNNDLWHQDLPGLIDDADQYDSFGRALVAGDFNGDGFDELAIGVSGQEVNGEAYAGAVHILSGHASGLISSADRLIDQDDLAQGAAKDSDHFGSALASSDFNGDGFDDLAVGVPDEDFWDLSPENCGAVNVIYGSELGLSPASAELWYQGLLGVADEPEASDQFGKVLAAGDFNGDGYGDLVIGVPYEDITYDSATVENAGMVQVLSGSASGITGDGDIKIQQDNILTLDEPGTDEHLGWALAAIPRKSSNEIFVPLVFK